MIKRQISSYVLIGLFHNIVFLVSYFFFTNILNINPSLFVIFSYPILIFIPYYLNGKFTFKVDLNIKSYVKYFLSFALLNIFNVLILEFFYNYLKFNHNLVQISFVIITAVVSFIISKIYIFKKN